MLPKIYFIVERWKYNEYYKVYVSNMGHICDEYKKPLAPKVTSTGYLLVPTIHGNRFVHRIVMLTWCYRSDAEDMTVDHIDHNKRNNQLSNLRWLSKEEHEKVTRQDESMITPNYLLAEAKNGDSKQFNTIDKAVEFLANIEKNRNMPKERIRTRFVNKMRSKTHFASYGYDWTVVGIVS